MSDRQAAANRANALKSTGPVTANGKAAVSLNAVRHGLLSAKLFLDDEDPTEFDALQCDLQRSLNPVGALELALVERIAVTMWRQCRLVAAETAAIALEHGASKIAGDVSSALNLSYSNKLTETDMEPFDADHAQWCRVVMDEIDRLEEIDLKSLEKLAPHVFGQLSSDAEEDDSKPEELLDDYTGGATVYIAELYSYCRKQLQKAEVRPRILALAQQVKQKRLVLPAKTLELFARYQTTLDNQIYKALKALREAQEWRLKTIEASAEPDSGTETKAA